MTDPCKFCVHEDFGYCALRNSPKELQFKNDKDGNLIKCSGFVLDKERITRMFKLKDSLPKTATSSKELLISTNNKKISNSKRKMETSSKEKENQDSKRIAY